MIKMVHGDCMEIMKQYPDKYFQLACVDPPYGIERFQHGSIRFDKSEKAKNGFDWDNPPDQLYFDELFRVSKNQIIWGANNFILPPSEYFCIWNKKQTVSNFASAEYAWVSMGLKQPAQVFDYSIHLHNQTDKIHPTQKPVALYKWLLSRYAKPGDRILDTHGGSGSICIACHDLGFDLTWMEKDEDYYNAARKRYNEHAAQGELFGANEIQEKVYQQAVMI